MEWEKIAGNKRRLTVKLGFTSLKPTLQLCRRHTDCFYLSMSRYGIENQIIYATISSRRIFLFAYLDVAFYRLPAPNHRLLVPNHCLLAPNHSLAAPNEKQISWAPFGSPSFIAVPLVFCVQSLCRKGAGRACRRLLLKRSRCHKAGEPYKMADWWVVSRLSFFFYLLLVACRSVFYVSCMILAFYVFSLTPFIRGVCRHFIASGSSQPYLSKWKVRLGGRLFGKESDESVINAFVNNDKST